MTTRSGARPAFGRLLLAAAVAAACPAPAAAAADTFVGATEMDWLADYDAALAAGRQAGQPVLVVFGAPWCEWCRKFATDLRGGPAKTALAGVTRVYLDFDAHRDLARKLGVGPIPAVRLVKATGGDPRIAGARDGYMPADEFLQWLGEARKVWAGEAPPVDLLEGDALTRAAVDKLVERFGDADVTAREAAVRRLLPHPAAAADAVVGAFTAPGGDRGLAVRLTALDLLEHWNAPVAGIDPWRPETVTAERLAALARWAASPEAAGPATAPALGDRALAEARDLLRRLLAAPDGDVLTLRERLARYGPALLPEIYDALRAAPSDQARDRLTLLRYRVTASEALALQWPVGLERLAAPAAKTRHAALDELAARATAADTGLLLELFSDPDALVRETALRLLQKVGGPSAGDALTRLLKDPDPNVRAAVLKSAAEQPSAAMAARVTEYVATEQDVDLVVHAARVLRNSGAATARKTLYDLLGHASWRVRAEAAEALASGTVAGDKPEQRADFYVRMLDLLADPDGFVASRAMAALERAEGLPDVRKVMLAAQKHPELAAMAVKIMCQNAKSDASALTYVKEFAAHPDAAVRARTIAGLMDAAGEAAAPEVKRALAYPDARVRMAACRGVMDQLDELLPGRYSSSDNKTPYDTFLTNFHAGRGRPRWLNDFRGALEPLLKAQTPAERAAAAAPLIALGYKDPALAVLKQDATAAGEISSTAAGALLWLEWDDRLALFNHLKSALGPTYWRTLGHNLAAGADPRAADSLWGLLAGQDGDFEIADTVSSELRTIYWGSDYFQDDLPAATRRKIVTDTGKYLDTGTERQRTVALLLLIAADPVAGIEAATKIAADPKASTRLRADAFQIQLAHLPSRDLAETLAAKYITPEDTPSRAVALRYFSGGADAIRYLHGDIYLNGGRMLDDDSIRTGSPIKPGPPGHLKREQVQPLLADPDAETAARAGYLLALFGDAAGLEPLMRFYRQNAADHDDLCRLVYRAIAALDDDAMTPTLAEIYTTLGKSGSWKLREFYWTIRSMSGDRCAQLRKKMRDEVGMENLR